MKIGILYNLNLTYLNKDSRVLKEVKSLLDHGHDAIILLDDGEVDTAKVNAFGTLVPCIGTRDCLKNAGTIQKLKHRAIRRIDIVLRKMDIHTGLNHYNRMMQNAVSTDADSYHANDFETLLLGIAAGSRTDKPVVYDAHEYFVGRRDIVCLSKPKQRFLRFLERTLAKKATSVITVNDSIAELMANNLKIKLPFIIRNLPHYQDIDGNGALRNLLGIPANKKIVIYQGGLYSERGLEHLMKASLLLEGVAVVALGYGTMRDELLGFSDGRGKGRFFVMDAVPPDIVLKYTASADAGISPMRNTGMNNFLTSGNKLGEYIMAGLPIAVSDFPEMRKLAIDEDMGVVFDPEKPEDIARAIRELLEPETYARKKKNVMEKRKNYCWENEERKLLELYKGLGTRPVDSN